MRVLRLSGEVVFQTTTNLTRLHILSKLGGSITIMTHSGEIRRLSVTLVNGLCFNNDACNIQSFNSDWSSGLS